MAFGTEEKVLVIVAIVGLVAIVTLLAAIPAVPSSAVANSGGQATAVDGKCYENLDSCEKSCGVGNCAVGGTKCPGQYKCYSSPR